MSRARSSFALILGSIWLLAPTVALAQASDRPAEPKDLIVLSGDVFVRRGQEVGEVVVLHGAVVVAGVARGDVVVIDGRITVTGQVSRRRLSGTIGSGGRPLELQTVNGSITLKRGQ